MKYWLAAAPDLARDWCAICRIATQVTQLWLIQQGYICDMYSPAILVLGPWVTIHARLRLNDCIRCAFCDSMTMPFHRLQLWCLLCLFPQLHVELSRKYGVTVTGFHKDSTLLKFDGSAVSVSSARQEVDNLLSKLITQEVLFRYPTVLVDSVRKRFRQENLDVHLEQLPEVTTSVWICSLSQAHLNRALKILEGKPFETHIHIPQVTDLMKLEHASSAAILKKGYNVSLQMATKESATGEKLFVYGFEKKDVQLAHQLLKTLVDSFTVKTVPLQCTPQEMAYFKFLYEENQTLEVKSLLEAIAPHVEVSSQGDTILLSGTSEAIQRANTQILQSRIFRTKCSFSTIHELNLCITSSTLH